MIEKNIFFNIKNIALSVKLILMFIITYLNLSKGDSGALIHYIGTFICNGNILIGLVIFGLVFLTYLTGSILAAIFCKKNNRKFIILSLILDIVFILINLIGGCYIYIVAYNMDFSDAMSKFSILTCGSGIIFVISSIIMIILAFFFF